MDNIINIQGAEATEQVTKDEQLQNYFGSFDTDLVDKLENYCTGVYSRKMARFIIAEVPNLVNTDLLSLSMLCNLLNDLKFLETQLEECRKENNLMVYHKLFKLKLDATSKATTLLNEYGLTPKSRKSILTLDMDTEEI